MQIIPSSTIICNFTTTCLMYEILGSAYILGAPSSHLEKIYEDESRSLEPWSDSPGEVSIEDWRDHLGDPRYQRAYVDFFEDQLVQAGYDWKQVLNKFLFEGKEPLFNNLISGLGHCLIHLGYAYELDSREISMEALGLTTCFYGPLHKYIDDPAYSKASSAPSSFAKPSSSTLEILMRIRDDSRFDDIPNHKRAISLEELFETHEAALLEHWNSWQLPQPRAQFEESQATPTSLLVGSYNKDGSKDYDFFLVHLLTTSHAVRILLPIIPPKLHVTLVKQWWLFVVAVYIIQGRPAVDRERFLKHDIGSKDWTWIDTEAKEGKWSLDAHFVKALRSMKVAAETWEDEKHDNFYLKAAVKMVEEYNGWGGFGFMKEG
ncbi:uncharacterized protein KY384_004228 [Bacidia gigantensis]|uniref:uncharacterized protein n=1 Tax=Bacidia gigantensis TaxID=2732470 RepID=UPI001D03CCCB|nr:uncharacterized protein KY384_004228 [Bacidia gigantensis]KAG8530871.1 hypothetical protein KY384_004228 [Bacidia gigantensis]